MITFTIKDIRKLEYYNSLTEYVVRVKILHIEEEKEITILINQVDLNGDDIKQSFIDIVSGHIRANVDLENMKNKKDLDINSIIGESFTI